jgi:hypothetical protein
VKLAKLTSDTVGIDNVRIQALSIGNISVNLAAATTGATGINLVGIRNSEFVTTGTGTTKTTLGGIGNVTVTLAGVAGGATALGILDSTFDALVTLNEFGTHPASTANALGKIAVKITGQSGASLGLDDVNFTANTIGTTAISVSRGTGGSANAIDLADFTATGAIGALTVDGDATGTQVNALTMSAGTTIGAVTVKAKTPTFGTINNSSILAGQALDILTPGTATELLARLAKATLGAVTLTGSLTDTDLVAGGSIGAVNVGGAMTDALVLAGARFGADRALGGGDDSFQRAAAIAAITVKGNFARNSLIAGIDPHAGGFGDGDDAIAAPAGVLPNSGSIGAITLSVGTLAGVTGTQTHAIQAPKITSLKVGNAAPVVVTNAQLLDLAPAGADADDVLVRLLT